MSTTEIRTETETHSTARMPFRIAAGVLAVLSPLAFIPLVAALVEDGWSDDLVGLGLAAGATILCTIMFARTALTGRTTMYTSVATTVVTDAIEGAVDAPDA